MQLPLPFGNKPPTKARLHKLNYLDLAYEFNTIEATLTAYRHPFSGAVQPIMPRVEVVATLNQDIEQPVEDSLKILGVMFKERIVRQVLERELDQHRRKEHRRDVGTAVDASSIPQPHSPIRNPNAGIALSMTQPDSLVQAIQTPPRVAGGHHTTPSPAGSDEYWSNSSLSTTEIESMDQAMANLLPAAITPQPVSQVSGHLSPHVNSPSPSANVSAAVTAPGPAAPAAQPLLSRTTPGPALQTGVPSSPSTTRSAVHPPTSPPQTPLASGNNRRAGPLMSTPTSSRFRGRLAPYTPPTLAGRAVRLPAIQLGLALAQEDHMISRGEAPAPPPYMSPPLSSSSTLQSTNNVFLTPPSVAGQSRAYDIPHVIVDTLDGIGTPPDVYTVIERCLRFERDYEPARWDVVLQQSALPARSIPFVLELMRAFVE